MGAGETCPEHGTGDGAAAERAAPLHTPAVHSEKTAREEEAHLAPSPVPQAGAVQQLALHLQLDETQIDAEVPAPNQAGAVSPEPCISVIPDTIEPCSNSKSTPKSVQQGAPGHQAPNHGQNGGCQAACEEREQEAQGEEKLPIPHAQPGREPTAAPAHPTLHDPAKRYVQV